MTTENNQTYVKTIKNLDSRKAKSGEDYYEVTYTDDTKDRFWRDHMPIVESAKRTNLAVKVERIKKDGFWNVQSVEITQEKPPVERQISHDDRIEAQVAVKAVVELAVGNVIGPQHPLVDRVLEWCAEKLRIIDYNAPKSSQEKQGTAEKPKVVVQPGSPQVESSSPIDLDWLRESLGKLQWADVAGYLKKKYNAPGVTVSEKVKALTLEQAKEFVAEVEERLKG